jgi:hypothetical protein
VIEIEDSHRGAEEIEDSHKGIFRETVVDRKYIESNDFRRKFDNATDNPAVNKALYDSAKEILLDRNGTKYETMYWLDGDTGEILVKFDGMGKTDRLKGEEHEFRVEYGDKVITKLKGHNNIITLHNHPNSTAPSIGDYNSASQHGYLLGFVIAHNGRLFRYSAKSQIDEVLYNAYIRKYIRKNCDEIDAQILAIGNLAESTNITLSEVFRK